MAVAESSHIPNAASHIPVPPQAPALVLASSLSDRCHNLSHLIWEALEASRKEANLRT